MSYRYRLYPGTDAEKLMLAHADGERWIKNRALDYMNGVGHNTPWLSKHDPPWRAGFSPVYGWGGLWGGAYGTRRGWNDALRCRRAVNKRTRWNGHDGPGDIHNLRNSKWVTHEWANSDTRLEGGITSVQRQALRIHNDAWKRFREVSGAGRPTYWRRRADSIGFTVNASGDRHTALQKRPGMGWAVKIPKLDGIGGRQWVRLKMHRELPLDKLFGHDFRVTRNAAGQWHVTFASAQQPLTTADGAGAIGIDLGVTETVALSQGVMPMGNLRTLVDRWDDENGNRLRRLERQMSRQRQHLRDDGNEGRRYERTKRRVAKLKRQRTDLAKNYIEEVTTWLVRNHSLIVIEDLNVKGLMKSASGTKDSPGTNVAQKRGLNRSIAASNWGMFRRRLEDKADASDVRVAVVNPAYTSQTCSNCGNVNAKARSGKLYACGDCGEMADADVNAARNILSAGMALRQGALCSPLDGERAGVGQPRRPVKPRRGNTANCGLASGEVGA